MLVVSAARLLASCSLIACASLGTSAPLSPCGGTYEPPPPARHDLREGGRADTGYARGGLTRLIVHVRSAGPATLDRPIAGATVLLFDSARMDRTPFEHRPLTSVTDSSGVAILDSI